MSSRMLSLTTWNLQGSQGVDVGAVAEHVRTAGCDLLALQEVQRHQARAVARELQASSLAWSFKHWPIRTWPEGMALVGITIPVRSVRVRAITARWRLTDWRRRIVQTGQVDGSPEGDAQGGGPIQVVNVHLSPHRTGADDRERELRDVLASVTGEVPTIVAGDFNTEPGTAPYEQMLSAGFTTPDKSPTKWRGTPSDRPPEREIDYVWVSAPLAIEKVSVPQHGDPGFERLPAISDHLPVTTTIRRR